MISIAIGRNSDNDVVIHDTHVSGYHVRITLDDSGRYFLQDLGSSNGSYVNGKRITQAYLQSNDIVKLADTIIPWQEYFSAGHSSGVSGSIIRQLTIGRSQENNIVLNYETVSGKHAVLHLTDSNEVLIEDLGSTNGTYVNDVRVNTAMLHPGDRLRLANTSLNWMEYLSPVQTSANKKRKVNGWFIATIVIAGVVLLSITGWGIASLVNSTSQETDQEQLTDTMPSQPSSFTEMVKYIEKAVFKVETMDKRGNAIAFGTGFFVSSAGIGVTNSHVLKGGTKWAIKTVDNREIAITDVMENNTTYDYAIFKAGNGGEQFNFLKIAQAKPDKGERIIVLGNPQGIESVLSEGNVSGFTGGTENDLVQGQFGQGSSWIMINVAISHGNSGSPVMNYRGEVIGIATLTFEEADCKQCNFAVNIDMLRDKLNKYVVE
ncbi:MAG: FHA domain-containing protein [Bacteroidota bacterium]